MSSYSSWVWLLVIIAVALLIVRWPHVFRTDIIDRIANSVSSFLYQFWYHWL